jgi:hypothetical protein
VFKRPINLPHELIESIQENIEEEQPGEVLTDEDIAEACNHSFSHTKQSFPYSRFQAAIVYEIINGLH